MAQILIRIPNIGGDDKIKELNVYLNEHWTVASISTSTNFKDYILKHI